MIKTTTRVPPDPDTRIVDMEVCVQRAALGYWIEIDYVQAWGGKEPGIYRHAWTHNRAQRKGEAVARRMLRSRKRQEAREGAEVFRVVADA